MSIISTHRARTAKTCNRCSRPINPGEMYTKIVTLPGSGSYLVAPDEYETDDWPFYAEVAHDEHGECLGYIFPGESDEQRLSLNRADEQEYEVSSCPVCDDPSCTFPKACQDQIGEWRDAWDDEE